MVKYFFCRYIFLFFGLSFTNSIVNAQNQSKIDSLNQTLKLYKPVCAMACLRDTAKLLTLYELVWELSTTNPDTALLLAEQSLQIAKKIKWELGESISHHYIGWILYQKKEYEKSLEAYNKSLAIKIRLEANVPQSEIPYIKLKRSKTLGNIGIVYKVQGDTVKALKYYLEALEIAEELGEKTEAARHLRNLGYLYTSFRLYDKAIIYFTRAMESDNKDVEKIAKSLFSIGSAYGDQDNYDKALKCFFQALNIYRKLNLKTELMTILNYMGIIFDDKGDYLNALKCDLEALQLSEEIGSLKNKQIQLGNIGEVYRHLGDLDEAIKYDSIALKLAEEINYPRGRLFMFGNIAIIYKERNDIPKALDYYFKALDLAAKIDDKYAVGRNQSNIANIYSEQGDYAKAKDYYFKALENDKVIKNNKGMAIRFLNIGSMYIRTKEYSKAEEYLEKALKLSDSIDVLTTKKDIYANLSEVFEKKGDHKSALFYYKEASEMGDSIFNESKIKEITQKQMQFDFDKRQALSNAEQEKKMAIVEADKRAAIAEADKKATIAEADKKTLIEKEERNRLLSEAEKKYLLAESDKRKILAETDKSRLLEETDKKIKINEAERKRSIAVAEREKSIAKANIEQQKLIGNSIAVGAAIIILSSLVIFFFYKRKRDAEQKQKETSLNLQVSETEMKALRSQMNPHFIFNALQSIQTFLLNHKSEEANAYLLKFAKLMRLVLENSQHTEVPLKEDIQALELYMQLESIRLQHPFTYKFHIDKSVDEENDNIPPLILQPFVENAIWHGLQYKPESGHIGIFISKKGNTLHATVEDNGVGRAMSKQVAHPMLLKKESLGMKLTEERLKILNEFKKVKAQFTIADLFTNDNRPVGTQVKLSLPSL